MRSAQRSLGSIVLAFEFLVVFLGALVAFGLKALPAPLALGGGAVLVVAMLLTIALLRYRWGFWIGWILQVIVLASGVLVPMMFIVGAIFGGMWAYCMITGARLDRVNAARAAHENARQDTDIHTDTTDPDETESSL